MDNTVRLWDPVTGELRLVLQGHPYWVTSVEFNHDSTYLVSSSFDGELRFWNAPIPANASDN
jgi:WD40 repeat protein